MRGASAVQSILARHAGAALRVFVVWEPILATDYGPPTTWVLDNIPDLRVQQYWDPERVVAARMARDAREPQPRPECCDRGGVLWDLIAIYPRQGEWTDRMPTAVLFNGPVVDISAEIESAVRMPRSPATLLRLPGARRGRLPRTGDPLQIGR